MYLTENELFIMHIFWRNKKALTASDIRELSGEKQWKDTSLFPMLNNLIKKGAIKVTSNVKVSKTYARTFKAKLSSEQYYSEILNDVKDNTSLNFAVSALFKNAEIDSETINALKSILEKSDGNKR